MRRFSSRQNRPCKYSYSLSVIYVLCMHERYVYTHMYIYYVAYILLYTILCHVALQYVVKTPYTVYDITSIRHILQLTCLYIYIYVSWLINVQLSTLSCIFELVACLTQNTETIDKYGFFSGTV